ncbi:MAG: transketolase [Clostridiales bacterium]|nr:transketolase [Clostridiales bacterium]
MNSKQLAWLIKRHGIEMTHLSHGSHIASILSVSDVVAVLYNDVANISPQNLNDENRDRIVLSKGHAGGAIYAALAEKGFFDREELKTHYQDGSRLSGHVSHKGIPGVEVSTGSLGHGVCMAAGMALNAKLENKDYCTFAIVGDGECDEGSVWEMALFANQFKLNKLVVIVDSNKMQSLDYCENTLALAPFAEKWKSFGWNVLDIDGHDHDQIREALITAKNSEDKPTVIIANTVKGKGISFMEFNILWHYRFPHEGEEYDTAIKELNAIKPEGVEDPYEVIR